MAGSDEMDQAAWERLLQALKDQKDEDFAEGLRIEDPEEAAGLDLSVYSHAFSRALRQTRRHSLRAQKDRERQQRAIKALRQPHEAGDPKILRPFRAWESVEAYLHLSSEARFKDLKVMLEYVERACDIACEADPAAYPPGMIIDLRTRATAELVNAYRVNEEYTMAEVALEEAKNWLAQSSGDPMLLPRLLDVEASLRIERRQFPEARELLDRAFGLYWEIGEYHLAGRTLVKRAQAAWASGDPRRAVVLLEEGISLLDPKRDVRLARVGAYTLIVCMTDSGEHRKAAELLLRSGLAQAFADEPLNALRLRWVESKIQAGLGHLQRAEAILAEVRAGFTARGLAFDAALAGLDLAALALRLEKPGRVYELAQEILGTIKELGLPVVEAQKALALVQLTAQKGLVTARIIQEAREFLVVLRSDPSRVFDPDGALQRGLPMT